MEVKVISRSRIKTENTGKKLASLLKPGDTVLLTGELGAGKTVFVKGICKGLKVQSEVTSPTFALINNYEGFFADGRPAEIVHCDAYRLGSAEELYDIGFFDAGDGTVSVCEWADNVFGIGDVKNAYNVRIMRRDDLSPGYREIYISAEGEEGEGLEAAFS